MSGSGGKLLRVVWRRKLSVFASLTRNDSFNKATTMVLQNKYKARASKRYNAARGGASGTSERGAARGTGRRGARPAVFGAAHQGDGEEEGSDEESEEDEEEEGKSEFPSLNAAAAPSGSAQVEEEAPGRGKYAKRKMESNAWRYAEPEVDPNEEVEPEAEVDLTNLFARVAALDSTQSSVPGSTDAAELQRIEDDVDTSLAYLHARQRERERGKGRGEDETLQQRNVKRVEMTPEEQRAAKEEMELMQKEREKAKALRALKERFMGRRVGERPAEGARSISLNIGAGRSNAAPLPVKRTLKRDPSLAFLADDEDVATAPLDEVDALLAASSKLSITNAPTVKMKEPASSSPAAVAASSTAKMGPIERERLRMAREEATARLAPGLAESSRASKDDKAGMEDFLDEILA